ncbi:MAG: MBOAT family protein [Flavobacteriales bacterium]|nr:MBOAT family protein [Flavobacteriales bacterium]
MLFNSAAFLVFLPAVLLLYTAVPKRLRHWLLLAASYFFYMWWRPEYILVIIAMTVVDFAAGILMEQARGPREKLAWLALSLTIDLGMLFYFKYAMFSAEVANDLLALFDASWRFSPGAILLPIGISFHTFQSLSYVFDVYFGRVKAERDLGFFALYIAYFPQLMAGPIERKSDLLPQLREQGTADAEDIRYGINKILLGFLKKVVVADSLAPYVDKFYETPGAWDGTAHLFAIFLFGMQIFCDFSGYSDIALGAARLMGVRLTENFNRPFLAKSINEYWQRWHITLGTWVRDYMFLPLMYAHPGRFAINVLIVFLAIGLWHGASWNFVLYGLVHGVATLLQHWYGRMGWLPRLQSLPGRAVRWCTTMAILLASGVFFRATSTEDALTILGKMAAIRSVDAGSILAVMTKPQLAEVGLVLLLLAGTALFRPALRFKYNRLYVVGMLVVIMVLGKSSANHFIYFQF